MCMHCDMKDKAKAPMQGLYSVTLILMLLISLTLLGSMSYAALSKLPPSIGGADFG